MEGLKNIYTIIILVWYCYYTTYHLFESMEEDECDYDHILIDGPITQSGEKEDCGVEGGNSNSCKDVFIKVEGLQSSAEDDINEDVELESQLRHTLDALVDEHEGAEIPSL